MAITIPITAADTMAKSALTNRPIVGIIASVRIEETIAASSQSDLTAAAIAVGANPAESAPLFVLGVIRCSGIILGLKSPAG